MKEQQSVHRQSVSGAALLAGALFAVVVACGSDDDSIGPSTSPDQTGQTCASASECYPGVDAGALAGEVMCLDRVAGGYCTHLCETDADCCATPGECKTNLRHVCSPFESTGQRMCFLSCEDEDITAAAADGFAPDGAALDSTAYCTTWASTAFKCRSSGGGSANRKVCTP